MQRLQLSQQLAAWQHHFQAQHQIAHGAVAHHVHATGVAGQVAADLAGTLAGEAQRKQPINFRRRLLHRLQYATGLHRNRVIGQIQLANAVELA